ncbi:TVP38/TMEM64 family protein [Geodermatophilus sp. DSM 44513]|uniref:TVP38/TMEM64 family protein n=1 Tax=Geodermatophilus sp. DSM 44513 TaxID=1528104 RepID=UPI001412F59C|nr:VTT domain-containing protein [Geodermatophilus sp. DSM 44513]WNV73715.1 VTT domain-containing protein [Geodermatophilus sp. DSM 44513]
MPVEPAGPVEPVDSPEAPAGRRVWLRLALLGLLIAAAAVVALTVDRPGVPALRGWLDGAGPLGWTAVVLVASAAHLTPVPRTALAILLGAAAGFPAGLAVAVGAGWLGGTAGFALGRHLGRDAVARFAGRRLARADRLFRHRGFLAVALARVSPVPFWIVSYAAGLSSIRWAPAVLGTLVGVVPGSVLHVAVGASLISWF